MVSTVKKGNYIMDRNQIIKTYLDLAGKAQEAERGYLFLDTNSKDVFDEAVNVAMSYYRENGITRQELTDYNDSKRNVVKCDNVNDALAALRKAFS
jgi:hypothetical protein